MAMLRRMPEVQEVLRLPRCAPAPASTPYPDLSLRPATPSSALARQSKLHLAL